MDSSNRKRILFLINSNSGGQRCTTITRALRQYSENLDSDVLVETLNFIDLSRLDSGLHDSDVVVVGGGDGTFSTLIPKLARLKSTIGILPLGTGNDLARELGLTHLLQYDDASKLVKFYRDAVTREVSYFNLEYGERLSSKVSFINYVSFGYEAKVVAEFDKLRKSKWWSLIRSVWGNRLGYAALSLTNMKENILAEPPLKIREVNRAFTVNCAKSVIFTNLQAFMGLAKSNLSSSVYDDNIECIVVDDLLNYFTMLLQYRLPLFHPRLLGSSNMWELSDLPSDVAVQIDGEPRPDIKSADYRISNAGKLRMVFGV